MSARYSVSEIAFFALTPYNGWVNYSASFQQREQFHGPVGRGHGSGMNFKANIQEAFLSSTDLPAGISYRFRRAGRLSVYENSDPRKAQIILSLA